MSIDQRMLRRAAIAALRGAGHAEPNPLVGCVIGVRQPGGSADIIGIGHHRRFGGPHAEVNAIHNAHERGNAHRLPGSTAWVTLEPCDHHGKTPPCTDALIRAGIAEIVIARADTHRLAAGGIQRLTNAGLHATLSSQSPAATRLTDPFFASLDRKPRRPWLIAKWAQTLDAKVATANGSSQWITGPTARRRVHALRARVDAIITGIGTILRDDPTLTARAVPVRRIARRIVLDPACQTPLHARIVQTSRDAPTTIVCAPSAAHSPHADALRAAGCAVLAAPEEPRRSTPDPSRPTPRLALQPALEALAAHHDLHTALLECGPTLLASAFRDDLIDEAWVFIAPAILGDPAAPSPAAWRAVDLIDHAQRYHLVATRRCAADTLIILRRRQTTA